MKVELDENKIKAYSYILGLYLGDGYINKTARTYRLRIALDKKYSQLNSFAKMNLQTLFPSNKIFPLVQDITSFKLIIQNSLSPHHNH